MIDFLKEEGISVDTIKKIREVNDSSVLFDLSCNKNECLEIIKYLK